jgi:large subunit ribosomal protein L10
MPSLINELALAEIQGLVDGATAVMVLDPAGLKAAESLALRRSLVKVGAKIKVAKANHVRRLFPDGLAEILDVKGSLAIVVGEDIAAAAKIVNDLVKADKVAVRGGLVEGKALGPAQAAKLADLPSREQLYGMLANVLAAPLTGLVRVLNEVPAGFVRVLEAARAKQAGE